MSDNWEDWENEDFNPILNIQQNVEQLKQIEERKLVEDSDNMLTNDLFQNNHEEIPPECSILNNNNNNNNIIIPKKNKKTINNQQINECKQKEKAMAIKKQKDNILRANELYGGNEYEEQYAEYEDKYH
jgi:hypothetical protein